jgi:hypothetical protein
MVVINCSTVHVRVMGFGKTVQLQAGKVLAPSHSSDPAKESQFDRSFVSFVISKCHYTRSKERRTWQRQHVGSFASIGTSVHNSKSPFFLSRSSGGNFYPCFSINKHVFYLSFYLSLYSSTVLLLDRAAFSVS